MATASTPRACGIRHRVCDDDGDGDTRTLCAREPVTGRNDSTAAFFIDNLMGHGKRHHVQLDQKEPNAATTNGATW
jgi:hypothetical protein